MSYLDVISLDEMLTYLRIDDEQNETDVEITSMLSAAFRYIERHTNTIIKQENRMYPVVNGSVLVYDKPINSIVTEGVTKETYSSFCELRTVQKEVEISVGYENPCDVPSGLKEVGHLFNMKAREYTRRVHFYETIKTSDGYGGNTVEDAFLFKSWAKVKSHNNIGTNKM